MSEKPLKVVVVEDDAEQRALFVDALNDRGFKTTACADAASLWRYMTVASCDVIVLDIGLPGEDGLSVAGHLREASHVGIVMLTGLANSSDQVRGLQGGADAYLAKPADFDVLAATVESVGRRVRALQSEADHAGEQEWKLVADGWKLCTPDRREIMLTAYERSMLQCLIAANGNPTDRETLIGALTHEVHDFDPHRLEMVIYRLRRKIKAVSDWALPLEAVRGVGYLVSGIDAEASGIRPVYSGGL